jgi:hypothetical protein
MIRSRFTGVLTLAVALTAAQTIHADVREDQKAKVEFGGMLGGMLNFFGGKAAREGTTSTVAVKGDRKVTLSDTTGQIIDLAEEKIYDLDMKKKTYKVTTFEELRRKLEEQRRKAEEEARKESAKEKDTAKPDASQPDPNAKQVEVDFNIKNTGEKKIINGFDTHQAVMTITVREKGKTLEQAGGMVMTSDMWLTAKIPAMKEILDFDVKYAKKLYGTMVAGVSPEQMAAAAAMYPMMKDAVAKMNAEGGKIEGTPIQTVTSMEAVPSAEQAAEQAKASDESKNSKQPATVGGMLGGFMAKKMQKKTAGDAEAKGGRTAFMTATTEVLKVTTDVSAAELAVPAGFKENK